MITRSIVCVSMAAICLSAVPARAAVVTMQFAGSFGTVLGTPFPGIVSGDTFAGTMVYNTSTPTSDDDGFTASYSGSLVSLSATVHTSMGSFPIAADILTGSFTQGTGGAAGQSVTNDEVDLFNSARVFDQFITNAASSMSNASINLSLISRTTLPNTGPLSSRDLPQSLDLSAFNRNQDFQFFQSFSSAALGTITSISVTPAPSAAALLGAGSLLVVGRRRR